MPRALQLSGDPSPRSKSQEIADLFAKQCAKRIPLYEAQREYRFAQIVGRQWRFDFCWPFQMIAVEIEGLVVRKVEGRMVSMGRHANVDGFREDCRKYATAAILGWTVLRFEQSMVRSEEAIEYTLRVFHARKFG